jgi:ABC-type uncharacterized transport system substrate-binding protein
MNATSFARPGGNVMGLALANQDVAPKHFELAKELMPKLDGVGVLANALFAALLGARSTQRMCRG